MKRILAFLMALALLLSCACAESAEETEAAPVPAETAAGPVVLQHTAVVQGKPLSYTTATGCMTVETDGGACEIFYVAYTLDGVEDLSKRPVTFAYNGGPGAASLYVQMGFLGPRRIDVDEKGETDTFPVGIKDNNYSILDLTDLVFIDPVGTGYSKPADGADLENFIGYDNDLRSVGDFIRLWTSRNGRWLSPKYLAGESYGTTRSVGLARYLFDNHSMNLNGILLISCICNFGVVMDQTNTPDLAYVLNLPTFAADAWYHKRLADPYQQMELEDLLKEVRSFAGGEYLSALFKGRTLDDAEKNGIAAKVAAYTGLTAEKVAESNLRIHYQDFCKLLLADQGLVIGRIDGRYTGPLMGGDMSNGAADPSSLETNGIYKAAFSHYISEELGYRTDTPYTDLSGSVNRNWSFPQNFGEAYSQEDVLYEIMSENRFLKIWVLCGYYDLATPFFSAEWQFDHLFVNDDIEANIRFSHYPSGHMFYLNEPSLAQFRKEAEEWYK